MKKFKKPERINIEFLPALFTIPMVAVFLILLISNYSYWEMFNWIIAGFLNNFYMNYILILLIILGLFGLYSIVLVILGIFRLDLVHIPSLNIIPVILLAIIDAIFFLVLNVNDRVSIDYVFFLLGPIKAELVYIAVSLGVFLIVGLIVYEIIILLKFSFENFKERNPKYRNKKFHPRLVAITTSLSTGLVLPIIFMLLLDYHKTRAYWENITWFFRYYFAWVNPWNIVWIFGIVLSIIYVILGLISAGNTPKKQKLSLVLIILSWTLQLIGLIGNGITTENQYNSAISGLSSFVIIPQVLILVISAVIPFLSCIKERFEELIKKKTNPILWRVLIIMGLLLIPYWFIIYQPFVFGPKTVYMSSQTHLETINGIEIPFQGDSVYPGFEWQSDATRNYMNLSGDWKFKKGTGSDFYSLSPRTDEILDKITNGEHLSGFNDNSWDDVQVPHAVSQYEDEDKYWGVMWYRRDLTIPQSYSDMDYTLKFYGVNYICDVWVDGNYLGYHEGAFTCFSFDVSEILTPGDHVIAVRVDNPEWSGDFNNKIVPDGCDFFNYGGIEREVWLETTSRLSIVRADVHQGDFETQNHLTGNQSIDVNFVIKKNASITNAEVEVGIYPLEFPDFESLMSRETWQFINWSENATTPQIESLNFINVEDGAATSASDKYYAYQIHFDMKNISFWSTKIPNLYALTINISCPEFSCDDFYCTQIGFRTIDVEGTNLTLNGAGLKLAGCSIHEQYPAPTGRCLTDEQHFTDLSLIKNLSANWWRASYSFHPISYLYSDRLGLGCWEESPVFWVNEIDMIQANARNYYESLWIEIIYRDFNRPSVLFWGACNEPWAQGPLYDYLKESRDFLDKYDPSRILSFACVSSHDWSRGFENLDVCTPNTYAGTFEGVRGDWYNELTAQLQLFAENPHNEGKPIVSMEFGYWRGGNDDDQKRCFEECFQAFSENPLVQGMTWWVFADYYGQDYYNSMGVYNHNRTWHASIYDSMVGAYSNYTANNL